MDINTVYSAIDHANFSSNPNVQKSAMDALANQYDQCDGFIYALLNIAKEQSAKPENRLLAVISLKNVFKKCWIERGREGVRLVTEEEKIAIKTFLLHYSFEETDKKTALQLALLTAKIASKDWPTHWPDLFDVLFSKGYYDLGYNDVLSTEKKSLWLTHTRAMATISIIFEELSTKSLPLARKEFKNLTMQIFPPLLSSIWGPLSSQFQTNYVNLNAFAQLAYGQQGGGAFGINEKKAYMNLINETKSVLCHMLTLSKVFNKLLEKSFGDLAESGVTAPLLNPFFESFVQNLSTLYIYIRNIQSILKATKSSISDGYDNDNETRSFDNDDEDDDDDTYSYLDNSEIAIDMLGLEELPEESILPIVRKLIKNMSSLMVNTQKNYQVEVVPYLPGLLEFFFNHVHEEYNSVINPINDGSFNASVPSLTIASILFLSNVLHCREYTADGSGSSKVSVQKLLTRRLEGDSSSSNQNFEALKAKGFEMKCHYFNEENVKNVLLMLLNRFLRYNKAELEEWETDPEQFVISQAGLRESDTVKSASEGLYLGLVDFNPTVVVTVIVGLLQDIPRQLHATSNNLVDELVMWDAVYLCTGLGAHVISKQFNPTEWLASSIGPLLNNITTSCGRTGMLKNGQQLIRFRFMWLLACWNYLFDAGILQTLLSTLVTTFDFQYNSDIPTLVGGANALKSLLYNENFSSELLNPVLVPLVQSLCALASNLQESENRSQIVELISELVKILGTDVQPMLPPLASHLGTLWASCDSNSPLRATIIEAMTEIVKAAGPHSLELHNEAMQLISYAISTNEGNYLVKEGVTLWLAVSRNIPPGGYNQALDELAKAGLTNITENISTSDVNEATEMIKELLCVMEAYAIISGRSFLISCASSLHFFYSKHLGAYGAKAVSYLMRPIEALLLSCPDEASEFLLQSGILQSMLRSICASMPTLADSLTSYSEIDITVVSYLSIFARLILLQNFNQLRKLVVFQAVDNMVIDLSTIGLTTNRQMLIHGLIYLLIEKFDNVGYCSAGMWKRKLWCISLLSNYPSAVSNGDSFMLEKFAEVVNISADVLSEEEAEEGVERSMFMANTMLALDADDEMNEESKEPITTCLLSLLQADIISSTDVCAYTKQKLIEMKQSNDETTFTQIMTMIGNETLNRYI